MRKPHKFTYCAVNGIPLIIPVCKYCGVSAFAGIENNSIIPHSKAEQNKIAAGCTLNPKQY